MWNSSRISFYDLSWSFWYPSRNFNRDFFWVSSRSAFRDSSKSPFRDPFKNSFRDSLGIPKGTLFGMFPGALSSVFFSGILSKIRSEVHSYKNFLRKFIEKFHPPIHPNFHHKFNSEILWAPYGIPQLTASGIPLGSPSRIGPGVPSFVTWFFSQNSSRNFFRKFP